MLLKVIGFSIIILMTLQNKALSDKLEAIPVPLTPKITVQIIGEIWLLTGKTFRINFQEGTFEPEGDTGLHISVRYWDDEDKLVLNSLINGEWGEEEVYYGLPARNGKWQAFDRLGYTIRITTRDDDFHISLNGKEYTFKYRMTKEKIRKLHFVVIDGDFEVTSVDFEKEVGYEPEYEPRCER